MARLLIFFSFFIALFHFIPVNGQYQYADNSQIYNRLQKIQKQYPNYIRLQSIGKSSGNRDIWLLTFGHGDRQNHQALAMVGGVEGDNLLSVELALKTAETIAASLSRDSMRNALSKSTLYIIPDASPDATAQYFSALRFERKRNARQYDNDRDGNINEDGFDDLNSDNLITKIRIKTPTGNMVKNPNNERLMRKADIAKGERGEFLVFSEGIDNDKDGKYNEDGLGGININRNFSFDYQPFTSESGDYPVSEKENRAIADFLFDAWNIFAVISFGEPDNLSAPLKFNRKKMAGKIITGWLKQDVDVNEIVSDRYQKTVNCPDKKPAHGNPGDFFQWAYFHYGRFSFSTPAWQIPDVELKADSANADSRFTTEEKFIRWAEQNEMQNYFVDWQVIDHPDFPDKTVEVGGIKPFLLKNPPLSIIDSLAGQQTEFFLQLLGMKPEIEMVNIKTEEIGNDLFRLSLDIHNKGILPTCTQIGTKMRWVRKMRLDLQLTNHQNLISGQKTVILPRLNGGEHSSAQWIVKGKGKITIQTGAPNTGFIQKQIELK